MTLWNDKNLVSRGNYGVRVARPGYDAGSCADTQLIFNSGWPILQICRVYDFSKKGVENRRCWYKGEWGDEVPAGYTRSYDNDVSRWGCMVNRKYVAKIIRQTTYSYSDGAECIEFVYKRISHQLGFAPFFLDMGVISNDTTKNKVVLFSIDIEKDIDYPYNDAPTPIISVPKDYGMKSSSIFPRVEGLSTGVFSKLVKAVKTQATSNDIRYEEQTGVRMPVIHWTPLLGKEIAGATGKVLKDYEPFAFSDCYAMSYDASTGNPIYLHLNDDGGIYYERHSIRYDYNSSQVAVGYNTLGQAIIGYERLTMVVFRSPLVSPEYVEVEV